MQRNTLAAPILAAIIAVSGAAPDTLGHGIIPRDTPVDRIVKNVEARLAKNPDDAEAHYVLGRAHALVFERKSNEVLTFEWGEDQLPEPASAGWQKRMAGWNARDQPKSKPPTEEELRTHLAEAINHLNRAIELDNTKAKYHLALASIAESGIGVAERVDVQPRTPKPQAGEKADRWAKELVAALAEHPGDVQQLKERLHRPGWDEQAPSTRDQIVALLQAAAKDGKAAASARALLVEDWRTQVTSEYFIALTLALPRDGQLAEQPIWSSLEDFVAYEAAKQYSAIVSARGPWPDEHIPLAVANATVKAFNSLPRPNAITPIVLSLSSPAPLPELTAPSVTTTFDLDGSATHRRWTWLKPDTGLLVWDPDHTGKITSGRQLFGSVSWWLFFQTGYEALDALDDNRDGRLSGDELRGIAVWFDRNSNGASDPGEVIPIESLPIAAIATTWTSTDGDAPCNRDGLLLTSGTVLPTYDWIARSAPAHTAAWRWPAAIAPLFIGASLYGARRRTGRPRGSAPRGSGGVP